MDADIRPIQRFDDFARMRLGLTGFMRDIRLGGGSIGHQMLTAECALIQRFKQIGQLGFGIGRNMSQKKQTGIEHRKASV